MTDTDTPILTIEDALMNIHTTCLDPDRAGRLIRRNVNQGVECTYHIRFYKDGDGINCETKLETFARPKFLGKRVGLE